MLARLKDDAKFKTEIFGTDPKIFDKIRQRIASVERRVFEEGKLKEYVLTWDNYDHKFDRIYSSVTYTVPAEYVEVV